jgi:hypothetical protein
MECSDQFPYFKHVFVNIKVGAKVLPVCQLMLSSTDSVRIVSHLFKVTNSRRRNARCEHAYVDTRLLRIKLDLCALQLTNFGLLLLLTSQT